MNNFIRKTLDLTLGIVIIFIISIGGTQVTAHIFGLSDSPKKEWIHWGFVLFILLTGAALRIMEPAWFKNLQNED